MRAVGIMGRLLHAGVYLISWLSVIFYTRWLWRDAGEFFDEEEEASQMDDLFQWGEIRGYD